MFKILKNQRGVSSLVIVLILGSAAAFIAGKLFTDTASSMKKAAIVANQWEKDLAAKRATLFGAYLISQNIVLCREAKWATGAHCKWQEHDRSVSPQNFGLRNTRVIDGRLTFDIDFDLSFVEGEEFDESVLTGELTFEIKDWESDKELEKAIGSLPSPGEDGIIYDHDTVFVFMTFKTNVIGENGKEQVFERVAATRRPLSRPVLQTTSSSACALACPSGETHNPFPECRGIQSVPENATTFITLKAVNQGPGVVYNLDYERRFDSMEGDVFQKLEELGLSDDPAKISFLSDQEYLAPGQEKIMTDNNLPCPTPKVITRVKYVRNAVEETKVINQHFENAASVRYLLEAGPNNEMSNIEPDRVGGLYDSTADASIQKQVTTVEKIVLIPPH